MVKLSKTTSANDDNDDNNNNNNNEEEPIASTSNLSSSTTKSVKLNIVHPKTAKKVINGKLVTVELSGGRAKKYICTIKDCDKAFTRPTRLDEHIRTHTGEVNSFFQSFFINPNPNN
jgi:hypothetical protein